MARNPTWTRDELILALDLYMRHRERLPDSDDPEILELSKTLNSLFGQTASDSALFRNLNGVYMKLANFRAVDPLHTSQGKRGLSRGGHGVEQVWTEFAERPIELQALAVAIRAASESSVAIDADEDDRYAEACEGRLLTHLHRSRERNRGLVRKKRESVLRETERLACEACGFDFAATYGSHGEGFIEVHHVQPLHTWGASRLTETSGCGN
jgi:5-methylcytosine-specific restriction enzyme A